MNQLVAIAILGILFVLLLWASFKRPGYAFAYVLFGQELNNIIHTASGFEGARYVIPSCLIIILIIRRGFRKTFIRAIPSYLFSPITIGYFILVSVAVISSQINPANIDLQIYAASLAGPIAILFMLSLLGSHDCRDRKELIPGMLAVALFTFGSILLGGDLASMSSISRYEINSVIGVSAISQGRSAGLLFLGGLFLLIFGSRLPSAIILIIVGLSWSAVVGTRGGMVAALVTITLAIVLSKRKARSTVFAIVALLIILVAGGLGGLSDSNLAERTRELSTTESIADTKRFARYVVFVENYPNYALMGTGPAAWYKIMPTSNNPHNLIMELAMEYGILGLVCIVLFVGFPLKEALKSMSIGSQFKNGDLLGTAWFFYFVAAMFSGRLHTNVELVALAGAIVPLIIQRQQSQTIIDDGK